jgi:hypothetical protein
MTSVDEHKNTEGSASCAPITRTSVEGYKEALSWIHTPEISEKLIRNTLNRVTQKIEISRRIHLFQWLSMWAGSVLITLYTVSMVLQDFNASGTFSYVSLLWTDSRTVLSMLSEQFMILIIDSLPVFSLSLMAGSLVLLLWSCKKSILYIQSSADRTKDTLFASTI